MSANYYKPGSWNIQCDRTGFKIKAEDARFEWNNLLVRKESFEKRHPQDYIKAKQDQIRPPFVRSQTTNFLSSNEVSADDL